MLHVQFKEEFDTDDITKAIDRMRAALKDRFTLVEFVLIQPEGAPLKSTVAINGNEKIAL